MTTLTPTEQLVFALEKEHAATQKFLEAKLANAENLVATLAAESVEHQHTIARQEAQITRQGEIMDEQNATVDKIRPTLFGAFMGGMISGLIFTVVIGGYIVWIQG